MNIIDYAPGDSLLHRLNPISKLALAVAIVVAAFTAQSFALRGCLLLLDLAIGFYAGIGGRTVRLAGAFVVLAAFMFAVQVLVIRTGDPVWGIVTADGLATGGRVALRLVVVALPLVLMLTLTRMNDLANAAVEILHVPYRYAFTFTTALRFVPIFADEMTAIMEAQTARGVEFDSGNPLKKLRLMLPLAAPLLISSVAKTDATALAAEQRGFYLRTRASSYKRYPFHARDVAAFACCVALVALGVAL